MLGNQGEYLRFLFTFTSNKQGKTGLSPSASVYRNGQATALATGVATEWAKGVYYFDLSGVSVNADGEYLGVAETSDGSVDRKVAYSAYTVGKAGTPRLDAAVSTRSTLDAAAVWSSPSRTLSQFEFAVTVAALGVEAALAVRDSVLQAAVENGVTLVEAARLWNAALGGKASGLAGSVVTFRDLADTKNRLVATVDAAGNRLAVSRDLS